ncbi:MAG: ATP-binding cassette domain-containing protein [Fimbriimonadaceae bacterium]|nr:ATP-binding cassette domain-containing protein [Fimbriimonadaceae bacterium]
MIVVDDLVKVYGRRRAVDHVSFEVEKGEIVGFLGPNGAGKTTTMRILTCFLPATGGRAQVAGFDIVDDSREVRRRLGYLPENVPLYLDLTVDQYLTYMGKLKGLDRSRLQTRLNEVVANCGLEHRRRDIIGKLSRGYRQRVGLAQALIHDPEVVILDEPTASLDPAQIREVRDYIKSLKGNHTLILSTHILPEVELTCDRVLMINNGRIVANDTPGNLRNLASSTQVLTVEVRGAVSAAQAALQPITPITRTSVVSDGLPVSGGARLELETSADVRGDVARALVGAGLDLLRLDQQTKSLEDIFVELTTEEPAAAAQEVA